MGKEGFSWPSRNLKFGDKQEPEVHIRTVKIKICGISRCRLLHIGWINGGVLLCRAGNCVPCP